MFTTSPPHHLNHLAIMPKGSKQAEAAAKKKSVEQKEAAIQRAVELYKTLAHSDPEKPAGYRTVCKMVEDAIQRETGVRIGLCYNTVRARLNGMFGHPPHLTEHLMSTSGVCSLTQFNQEKAWLQLEEERIVVDFILELASRGWPLNKERTREHINGICRARLGDTFPEDGVGKCWVDRFLDRHRDLIQKYRPRPLESLRGQAVNPFTHRRFYDILGKVLETGDNGSPITEENIYGSDESAFQTGVGSSNEKVIGAAGKRIQHQQKTGNRENITVMVTICADGTSVPPAVIFKGSKYLVKWKQENPTNAM